MKPGFTPAALVGSALALAVMAPLGVEYLRMLGPSAEREGEAACRALQPSEEAKSFAQLPAPLRDFQAQDSTDQDVSLSSYRGQVVMLNFWATWCPPCQKEMASMDLLQRALGREGLVVLAVASDKDWKAVHSFFPDGADMKVVLDPPDEEHGIGAVARDWGVPALPETFLIDRKGNVRYYIVNKRDWSSEVAKTCLRSLLDE